MKRPGIAIAGAGRVAGVHPTALSGIPEVKIPGEEAAGNHLDDKRGRV